MADSPATSATPQTSHQEAGDPSAPGLQSAVAQFSSGEAEHRLDAAHPMRHASESDLAEDHGDQAEARPPRLLGSPKVLAQHAADLADRLQNQLGEVDRRESRLNSQEAEFDTRIRSARLWIEQCETELAEKTQALAEQEEQFKQQCESAQESLNAAEGLDERIAAVAEDEQRLERLKLELEIAVTEQQTKNAALDFQRSACRTQEDACSLEKQKYEARHRELDQREAALYVEQERNSEQRLAFDRLQEEATLRETELTKREALLEDAQQKLRDQASEHEFARAELEQRIEEIEHREHDFETNVSRLEIRQREIETAVKRFERMGIVEERMVEIEQQSAEFAMRTKYLDNAEEILADQQQTLAEERRVFEQERQNFENVMACERREQQQQTERTRHELEHSQSDLAGRLQELDQRETTLEKLADELRRSQREALEMRLAAEETWAQLQGVLAPAALTRSIAMVRGKIADHYQLAAAESKTRRRELEQLRTELADQHDKLTQRSHELQRWSQRREQDIEEQAARLIARENELNEQARDFERRELDWANQETEHQAEVQRLLAIVRHEMPTAA